jgi:hypothetical protein
MPISFIGSPTFPSSEVQLRGNQRINVQFREGNPTRRGLCVKEDIVRVGTQGGLHKHALCAKENTIRVRTLRKRSPLQRRNNIRTS